MDHTLFSFIFVTIILTITPGADTFIVIRNVIRGGKIDGIVTGLGICTGLFFHATLSILGVSLIIKNSASVFYFVKIIGAIYLLWLGIVTIYGTFKKSQIDICNIDKDTVSSKFFLKKSFTEGLLSNILNPKPALFYLAFFPQFINSSDPVIFKSTCLVLIQFIIGIMWLTVLSLFIVKFKCIIGRSFISKLINSLCGMTLIAFGIKLGMEK